MVKVVLPHQKGDSKNVWVKPTLTVAYLTNLKRVSNVWFALQWEPRMKTACLYVCVYVYEPVLAVADMVNALDGLSLSPY